MTDPTDRELDDLLERFAAEQTNGDLDLDRTREMLADIYGFALADPEMGPRVRELVRAGATPFVKPLADGAWLELRLGYPDDPVKWPKAHGQSVPLGKFERARVLARPQG